MMKGFGVHTSMWTMTWDKEGSERELKAAMESFIDMPPEIAHGLAIWRPVAESREVVLERGLPFLRNKAIQYRLI